MAGRPWKEVWLLPMKSNEMSACVACGVSIPGEPPEEVPPPQPAITSRRVARRGRMPPR